MLATSSTNVISCSKTLTAEYGLNSCVQSGSMWLFCLHLKHLPNFMSFVRSSFVNLSVLVVGGVVVLVVVLGRRGCKICENWELVEAALVVNIMAKAVLVGLVAIGLVFWAAWCSCVSLFWPIFFNKSFILWYRFANCVRLVGSFSPIASYC